jgi:hypothetical protein
MSGLRGPGPAGRQGSPAKRNRSPGALRCKACRKPPIPPTGWSVENTAYNWDLKRGGKTDFRTVWVPCRQLNSGTVPIRDEIEIEIEYHVEGTITTAPDLCGGTSCAAPAGPSWSGPLGRTEYTWYKVWLRGSLIDAGAAVRRQRDRDLEDVGQLGAPTAAAHQPKRDSDREPAEDDHSKVLTAHLTTLLSPHYEIMSHLLLRCPRPGVIDAPAEHHCAFGDC